MCPARVPEGKTRGYIMPIGGAENKLRKAVILKRFIEICGGSDARIAVIPTASRLDDTGDVYKDLFLELGAHRVYVMKIEDRADCNSQKYLDILEKVDGVFVTGGNQLRLTTILGGTPMARSLRNGNAGGMHIAGTSAGAAFMPEHMIASGKTGPSPKANMVQLAPGMGLINKVIIDQHFRQRDRIGRLLSAIAYNPFSVGIGLDEDTAALIGPDDVFEVVGSGAVTVVDPADLEASTMHEGGSNDAVSLIGVKLHILASGATFDMNTRKATA